MQTSMHGQARATAPAARPARAGRGRLLVRAELTVPRTPTLPQPAAAAADAAAAVADAASSSSASACPFLAAVRSPRVVKLPWHQRFKQIFDPTTFQRMLLGAQPGMVHVPQQLGFVSFYMPDNAAMIKEAFAGEADGTTAQAQIGSFAQLMGEDSLILLPEPAHSFLRGLLKPAFSPEAISSYLPDIASLVARHLGEWEDAGADGVKGYDRFKLLTFDFIISITMGRAYDREQLLQLSRLYREWSAGFLAWPWLPIPFTPWARSLAARRSLIAHFMEATTEARDRLAAGEQVPGVLGMLVSAVDEAGNRLTDAQIADNVLLVLLAGHDTSSTTLTQVLSNLQDHPRVLAELRAEQAAVVAKHGPELTSAALKDMAYADAVIRETLRRDPVVAQLFRVAAKDFTLGDYTVPAGQHMLLPLKFVADRDARWAGEDGELAPSAFVPERMMTPEGLKQGAQLPFGYGPRYCLGAGLALAEMKVFLAQLARKYDVRVDNNTEWQQAVGRVPKNGLPLVLTPLTTA